MTDPRIAGANVKLEQPGTLLFLPGGRLFVRRDNGEISEADASERDLAILTLTYAECGTLDPVRGLELLPPAES